MALSLPRLASQVTQPPAALFGTRHREASNTPLLYGVQGEGLLACALPGKHTGPGKVHPQLLLAQRSPRQSHIPKHPWLMTQLRRRPSPKHRWPSTFTTPAYSFDADPNFSTEELVAIVAIWRGVAEDYAPFNIDVTTGLARPGARPRRPKPGHSRHGGP